MRTVNPLWFVGVALLLTAACAARAAGSAYPQNRETIQLQKDVINLKTTISELQASVDQKNAAIQSLVEKIFDQVNNLAGSVQKVNQAVENVNSHTDKSAAELRTQINTFGPKLTELTDSVSALKSQLGGISQQITAMKATAQQLPSIEESWRTVNLDVQIGNYELALQELSEFQAKYPNDPRTAKAQILKGDVLGFMKKADQAVIEYDTFLQKYPENEDTSVALYKKGLAQVEINDPKATATLQSVVTKYPNSPEATLAKQKIQQLARGKRGPGSSQQ